MRKLTETEADNIPSKQIGKQSTARIFLMNMKVGEIILLEKSEWHQKQNTPAELIRRMKKTVKAVFTCATALDGSGWIIRRLK